MEVDVEVEVEVDVLVVVGVLEIFSPSFLPATHVVEVVVGVVVVVASLLHPHNSTFS